MGRDVFRSAAFDGEDGVWHSTDLADLVVLEAQIRESVIEDLGVAFDDPRVGRAVMNLMLTLGFRSRDHGDGPLVSSLVIGRCPTPDCKGEIIERTKVYGCTSWRSPANPGCGFTIWKQQEGYRIPRELAAEMVAERRATPFDPTPLGPCPRCRGKIIESSWAFGCDSYKGKRTPGCGYVIWKQQDGYRIPRERAVMMVSEGAEPFDPTPLGRCPRCPGEIIESSWAFGCDSYRGKRTPGCGYVIWKNALSPERRVTRADALAQLRSDDPEHSGDA